MPASLILALPSAQHDHICVYPDSHLFCAETRGFSFLLPPSSTIYLDLEGNCLSRHGTISLVTVLIHPQRVVRLIDVLVLGKRAFTTASNNGKTLKSILEDTDIPKCTWDVRNDADALWALYLLE